MSRFFVQLSRGGLVIAFGLAVSGCAKTRDLMTGREKVTFDGQNFRSTLAASKEDRAVFGVTVRDAAKSLSGAREAARYEATKYCIEQYGNSRVDWAVGPDAEDGQVVIRDGDLDFNGVCQG